MMATLALGLLEQQLCTYSIFLAFLHLYVPLSQPCFLAFLFTSLYFALLKIRLIIHSFSFCILIHRSMEVEAFLFFVCENDLFEWPFVGFGRVIDVMPD